MATIRPRLARPVTSPFRLLEISIISAQDLAPIAKTMRTYGVAWLNPDRKLITRVDQNGHSNPTWNEKFVFRVDDKFLSSEDSTIEIEIYTTAWLRDVLVGSVNVLIGNVFVDYYDNCKKGYNYSATTRFVALQIRRPSGRPQGILNVGFTLLDTTMKSMPLRSELSLSFSGDGSSDLLDQKNHKFQKIYDDNYNINHVHNNIIKLRRTQSDRTDLTVSEDTFGIKPKHHDDMIVGSTCGYSSMVGSSELNGKGGSMVNSSLCNSDVGPSASIVAAAIAKGLIKIPAGGNKEKNTPTGPGNSILEGWTAKNKGEDEAFKMTLERWRTEVPPVYDHQAPRQWTRNRKRRKQRRREAGRGLFSCFGNVFGCEISITCGRGDSKRYNNNNKKSKNKKVFHLSAVDDNQSHSYA